MDRGYSRIIIFARSLVVRFRRGGHVDKRSGGVWHVVFVQLASTFVFARVCVGGQIRSLLLSIINIILSTLDNFREA